MASLLLLHTLSPALQLRSAAGVAADAYLWAQSMVVSGLHFAGIVKPNPAVKQEHDSAAAAAVSAGNTAGDAMSATAQTAAAALTDPSVLKDAVEQVAENIANVKMVSGACGMGDWLAVIRGGGACCCYEPVRFEGRCGARGRKHGQRENG